MSRRGGLSLDDEESLISRARGGALDAFDDLVRRHQEYAFRAAFLVLRDAADAEDAAQEGFVRAYWALGRFQPGRPFRPWLLRIVTNQALNMEKARRRRRKMAERAAGREEPAGEGLDEAVAAGERRRRLWSALSMLPDRDRVVLHVHYFLALSEGEAAQLLGCRPGTVKSRLHRAGRRLRQLLLRHYPDLVKERA